MESRFRFSVCGFSVGDMNSLGFDYLVLLTYSCSASPGFVTINSTKILGSLTLRSIADIWFAFLENENLAF